MIKPLAFVFLREGFPIEFRSLKEAEGSHHVGLGKSEGVFDGAVNVGLGGQMDNAVYLLVLHELVEGIKVADVHLDELVVGLILYVLEVGKVAGIGQLVKIDNLVLGIFVDEEADHMAPNEACASGDYYVSFHNKKSKDKRQKAKE